MTNAHTFESLAAAAAAPSMRAPRFGSAFSFGSAAACKPTLPGRLTPPSLLMPEAGLGQRST